MKLCDIEQLEGSFNGFYIPDVCAPSFPLVIYPSTIQRKSKDCKNRWPTNSSIKSTLQKWSYYAYGQLIYLLRLTKAFANHIAFSKTCMERVCKRVKVSFQRREMIRLSLTFWWKKIDGKYCIWNVGNSCLSVSLFDKWYKKGT